MVWGPEGKKILREIGRGGVVVEVSGFVVREKGYKGREGSKSWIWREAGEYGPGGAGRRTVKLGGG